MGRRSREESRSRTYRDDAGRVASADVIVERLSRRFMRFRRDHPPQSRIPEALRAAVLAAMRQGVAQSRLRRTCGLGSGQIDRWKQGIARKPTPAKRGRPRARVFEVSSETPAACATTDAVHPDQQLELRVGPWSICVRQVSR